MESESSQPGLSWGYAYVLNEEAPNYLIGKIMPIIEIMGLSDKQEEALKDQIKQIVRREFNDGIYIKPERHNKIREDYYLEKEKNLNNNPISAV